MEDRTLMISEIIVKIKNPYYYAKWNLLDKRNLTELGIDPRDIKDAIPAFFHVPGRVYEEVGVGGPNHPVAGSCGCYIITYNKGTFGVQEIMYHDRGHRGGQGKPHWNHERRFLKITDSGEIELKRTKHVDDHYIPDSPYIDWLMNPGPNGKPVGRKVHRPKYKFTSKLP